MKSVAALTALALSAVIAVAATTALAAGSPEDEAFQKRLFGRAVAKQRIHACFHRVYDTAHLAQHPQQNVRSMLLLVTGDPGSDNVPSYGLGMGVTFRKSGVHFESNGNCGAIHDTSAVGGSANVAHCGVDCDGGSIDVSIRDATSVLVAIPDGARLWQAGADDEETSNGRRKFGSDDKIFRLDKAPLVDCLNLVADVKDKAAMRRGQ